MRGFSISRRKFAAQHDFLKNWTNLKVSQYNATQVDHKLKFHFQLKPKVEPKVAYDFRPKPNVYVPKVRWYFQLKTKPKVDRTWTCSVAMCTPPSGD